MQTGKLLLDDYPLIILPRLAVTIGLNEAIVLQQIHYWLQHYRRTENECEKDEGRRHFKDGRWWVYNSVDEWSDQFPFWSSDTVKRTLASLRTRHNPTGDESSFMARGPLLIATPEHNESKFDKTLWYTIDYEELDRLCNQLEQNVSTSEAAGSDQLEQHAATTDAKPSNRLGQNAPTADAECPNRLEQDAPMVGARIPDGSTQIAPLDSGSANQPIPETTKDYTEISSENTAETASAVAVTRRGLLKRLSLPAAPAVLLEEFGVDASAISADDVDPVAARAWMLYALTQPGLSDPQAYVAKRLAREVTPFSRFFDWARLAAHEWQALWRAGRYDGRYRAALPSDLTEVLDAWLEDFDTVFPAGPFGDGAFDEEHLRSSLAELEGLAGDELDLMIRGHAIQLAPATSEAALWLREHLADIREVWAREEVLHDIVIAPPRERVSLPDDQSASSRLWQATLAELQLQMTQATFDARLRDSRLVKYEEDTFVVAVESDYTREWLEHRLLDTVERTLARLLERPVEVCFTVLELDNEV